MNNTYLPVPDACLLSCNKCIPVQRADEMSPLAETQDDGNVTMMADEYTTESTTTTTTTIYIEQNMIFSRSNKCFNKRDDCLLQKQYGFCEIFNDKYPYDCRQTCHPDCASQS